MADVESNLLREAGLKCKALEEVKGDSTDNFSFTNKHQMPLTCVNLLHYGRDA